MFNNEEKIVLGNVAFSDTTLKKLKTMQQKMRKLIGFLIFGLTISLISSCKEDILITHEYTVKGCINNNSSDSLDIQWYWTNYEEPRSYSMSLAPGEFQEIDDGDDADVIIYISYDSVMLSNSKQKIVYIPHPRTDSLDHCVPLIFMDGAADLSKSEEFLHYYTYNITDSTFQFMADECAKLGQDIWRKK